jgi:GNAT superfamily N-acetyltransferase
MVVSPLTMFSLQQIEAIMSEGRPWLPQSTDYWLWQACFGSTSFIAAADKVLTGGILACVNQSRPDELYIDQVAVHAQWRGRGVTRPLLEAVENEARKRGCKRLWLSTDPANPAARAWPRYGFALLPGNDEANGLPVTRDFKGPGKHRATFERRLI